MVGVSSEVWVVAGWISVATGAGVEFTSVGIKVPKLPGIGVFLVLQPLRKQKGKRAICL